MPRPRLSQIPTPWPMRQRWSVITWFFWWFLDVWVLPGHLPVSFPQLSSLTTRHSGLLSCRALTPHSKLFFQMIQAIQVLRFHLLELEKVSRKWYSPFWFSHLPLSVDVFNKPPVWGMGHLEVLSNLLHCPSFKSFNPRAQRMGELGQPWCAPPTPSPCPAFFPRHSGLFWNATNHLCYWTFSLLASLLA